MKKIDIKENKGITLITLILAIIIMIIISSTLIYNAGTGAKTRALNNMYNDVKNLKDRVEIYYSQYGALPIINTPYTNVEEIKNININDNDLYYVIDLEAIDNLTLTYGKDYKSYKTTKILTKTDIYIINEKSHTIYYVDGIQLDEKTYYTVPDEYTKIEIPEVNKITLQKLDKGIATIQIDATNKNVGIKKIKLYKGDITYKTYEYTEKTKERKKEILDIPFVAPEKSEWYIEAVDTNENITQSNKITINSDYYLKVTKPEEKMWDETKIDCYQDEEGVVIPVPKGFTPILKKEGQRTARTGFVIRDTSTNIQTRGNEFVWVPSEIETASNKDNGKLKYDRYAFTKENWNYMQTKGELDSETSSYKIIVQGYSNYFQEAMSEDERISIETYGGYYIGRYEAGIEGGTLVSTNYENNSELTDEQNEKENWTGYTGGKLVIKKGQQVWNYITRNRAIIEAEKLYNKAENNVKSKLCSSYAWDTALKFMQEQEDNTMKNYPTNSIGGNYEKSGLTQTGYDTIQPCNIYDMGGNISELTTELYSYDIYPVTIRGGSCNDTVINDSAAKRSITGVNDGNEFIGFRVTLYM